MRAVVQRVSDCSVTVHGTAVGGIARGILAYLGIGRGDDENDAEYLVEKIINLRIFPDDDGKMNRSLLETGGGLCVISQFTLYGDTRKGRRPSYSTAALPEEAEPLYRFFIETAAHLGIEVSTGAFGEEMRVDYANLGPVTLLIDSRKLF